MPLRLLFGVAIVALSALAVRLDTPAKAAPPYTFGNENSWIRVQNVGSADANVELSYFDEQGRVAGRDTCPSAACPALFPGSGWTFFQRGNPNLPAGYQGSAVISTDQPVVSLLAKDVVRGNSFSIGGDTVVSGEGSHRLYLPWTAKRDGAFGDWNGRFAIQNLSDTVTACLTITYLSNEADDEVAWEPFRPTANVAPANPRPGCPLGGLPLPPRGSIFRYPENMPVPDRFTGSVRIDLHRNAQNQGAERQFLSASADAWNSRISSFGSYRGIDEAELGTEIILPLVDRQVGPGNSYSTRFQIVNKTPTRPAQVTLRFDGYNLGVDPPQLVSRASTFSVKGSRLCFQDRDDFANCLPPGERLPANFVGTARITSNEPLAVIVDRATTQGETFTDYRGVRPQDGARRVLLPVLNKNFGAVREASGWNSWFRIMVADGGTANITVRYYGLDLPGGTATYTVDVNREFTVFQNQEPMLPNGFAGTAIIESDKPIVALANLSTDVFQGDSDLLYNGIALDR